MRITTPWEVDHARFVLASEAFQLAHNGALPETPIWHALEHRFELNPARFTHWHPNIAYMIRHQSVVDSIPIVPSIPIEPIVPITVNGGVPEPQSLILLFLGIVSIVVVKRIKDCVAG